MALPTDRIRLDGPAAQRAKRSEQEPRPFQPRGLLETFRTFASQKAAGVTSSSSTAFESSSVQTGSSSSAGHEPTDWWKGRPLSEAVNEHRTNTKEDFAEALESDANFFECDVRKELNSGRLECRHDSSGEAGDNLTLAEWLKLGKESGRGLKIELKEPQYIEQYIKEIKAAGIPSERLMLNLQLEDMQKFGPALRKNFPDATLAISHCGEGDKLTAADTQAMIDAADRAGGPVTFVCRYDQLTDTAIDTLQQRGPVSAWNELGKASISDPEAVAADLRSRGVEGMIDLRKAPSIWEYVQMGASRGFYEAKGFVEDTASKVTDGASGLWEKGKEGASGLWDKGKDFVGGLFG